jgi:hypothetical protein
MYAFSEDEYSGRILSRSSLRLPQVNHIHPLRGISHTQKNRDKGHVVQTLETV